MLAAPVNFILIVLSALKVLITISRYEGSLFALRHIVAGLCFLAFIQFVIVIFNCFIALEIWISLLNFAISLVVAYIRLTLWKVDGGGGD